MKIIANDGENVDRFQDRIYLLDRCQSSKVHLALLHEQRVNQKTVHFENENNSH